jgi:hypothetical protein
MKAYELLHAIASLSAARRCLIVTTGTTGHPTLNGISLARFDNLHSVRIGALDGGTSPNRDYASPDKVAAELDALAVFDIAFVDPHHSYADSMRGLALAEARVADAGWLIVHDCFPPYELTGETFQADQWCGQTFSAFRDFATAGSRAWFVVDGDFGLGVLGPRGSAAKVHDRIDAETESLWREANPQARRDLLATSGRALLRVAPAELAEDLVSRIIGGGAFAMPGAEEFRPARRLRRRIARWLRTARRKTKSALRLVWPRSARRASFAGRQQSSPRISQ